MDGASGQRARVVVVGLGPAGDDHLTPAARSAIDAVDRRFVRTARHPAADAVPDARSFDDVYESSSSFDEVYARIVGTLVEESEASGTVVYAVPGSPLVAERSVELLRADGRVAVEIVPGMSFLDLAWARLGVDPVGEGVKLVDASSFLVDAGGETGPFLVAQCWSREVLAGVKLALDAGGEDPGAHSHPAAHSRPGAGGEAGADDVVTILYHLGLPDESVWRVRVQDLDRLVEPDHLTSAYVPRRDRPVAAEMAQLDELVRTLRSRCPWDRRQTHQSLVRHLVEETYEVVDAIESLDGTPASYGHLEEELGDLLFQVFFHSVLAGEQGQFAVADVARGVHAKLVARHPHVFGDVEAHTAEDVMANWERIKKSEKGRRSVMEGIPASLPSLAAASKVLRKAAAAGIEPVEPADLNGGPGAGPAADLGEALLCLVELARRRGVDPESALRSSTSRLRKRFEQVEELAAARGLEVAELEPQEAAALWASTAWRPT